MLKSLMNPIFQTLQETQKLIHEYESRFHRPINSVTLLAVSKGQSSEVIRKAYGAGQKRFGENYLQEALSKIQDLADLPLEWHFIGPIQSNKTKKIAENFHWVQSLSDIKIAERLNNQRPLELPPLNVCIQVNISKEISKSGIDTDALIDLANACLQLPRLKLRGLMAIPILKEEFEAQRIEFKKLHFLYEKLCKIGMNLDTLSMGMSEDLLAAIAEGSTMVRIGTRIFGKRK